MKFKDTLFYRMTWIVCLFILSAGINHAVAGTVNVQFANPTVNCTGSTPTQFCITVQVRAQSGTLKLGNSTVFFQYNANAINNPVKTAGSDAAFSTGSGYGFAPQFSFLEQGNTGEGNFNILLGSGSGSPTTDVNNAAWSNVAQFCFTIVNSAATANLSFNTSYTGFNDQTNNPANQHTLGTSTGYTGGLSACSTTGTVVQLKAFLEGTYSAGTGLMGKNLNTGGYIPATQPYTGTPWNYAGTESLGAIPTDMTDWVLVSAATYNGSAWTIVERKAAVLKQDGTIVDASGSTTGVTFSTLTSGGNYYFVVRHRNHLSVVTPSAISVPNATPYNFGTAQQTFGAINQEKQINGTNPKFCMIAGNGNVNDLINSLDFIAWKSPFTAGAPATQGYKAGDYDLSGLINSLDFVKWKANFTGGFTQTVTIPQQ